MNDMTIMTQPIRLTYRYGADDHIYVEIFQCWLKTLQKTEEKTTHSY